MIDNPQAPSESPAQSPTRLPRNVWLIAWVAFFNDTSTEMAYWLLPQFLVAVLGAPPMAFGFLEGAAETVSSFSRLLSGWISDRLDRRQPLAAAGYTLANVVKPLLAVSQSWPQVFWIRFSDRAAKGLRAAPRDALMADSLDPSQRGAGFGLRQAMDTAGAVAGPLSAIVLLHWLGLSIREVFALAALPGLVTILLACFAVKEVRKRPSPEAHAGKPTKISLLPRGKLAFMLVALGMFSLGNSSDLFLVLRAQNLGLAAWMAPVLGLLFNIVYAMLSWPAGKISDHVPRRWLIVAGYLIYAAVYAGFALLHSAALVWFLFAVYGSYYALTEGVMKAWIADLAPADARASVFGAFNWVVGVAALPASLLAGWLWQKFSPAAPFAFSGALALLSALILLAA